MWAIWIEYKWYYTDIHVLCLFEWWPVLLVVVFTDANRHFSACATKLWASVAAVLCARRANIRPCWGCCSRLFGPYMVWESCAHMFGSRLPWSVTRMSDSMTSFQDIHAVYIKAQLRNYCLQKILSLCCSGLSRLCSSSSFPSSAFSDDTELCYLCRVVSLLSLSPDPVGATPHYQLVSEETYDCWLSLADWVFALIMPLSICPIDPLFVAVRPRKVCFPAWELFVV